MAYDKVVDSSVLNAGLKSIADAIRAKAGTSGNLEFPTAMAEAIAAIEAGGESIVAFETGSITLTEDFSITSNNQLVVEHNLGYIPDLFMLWRSNTKSHTNQLVFAVQIVNDGDLFSEMSYNSLYQITYMNRSGNGSFGSYHHICEGQDSTVNSVYLKSVSSTACILYAGYTYEWFTLKKVG